jgi:signal peptidase I
MLPTEETPAKRKTPRRIFTGFGLVLLSMLGFVLFFYFNLKRVIVSGQSMMPTLKNGKEVFVSDAYWLVGAIRDGDIVVIKGDGPGDYIIKRVYKMGGETVDVINMPLDVPLASAPYIVPAGEFYVLGDNRAVSEDSRRFHSVEFNRIIGKVILN